MGPSHNHKRDTTRSTTSANNVALLAHGPTDNGQPKGEPLQHSIKIEVGPLRVVISHPQSEQRLAPEVDAPLPSALQLNHHPDDRDTSNTTARSNSHRAPNLIIIPTEGKHDASSSARHFRAMEDDWADVRFYIGGRQYQLIQGPTWEGAKSKLLQSNGPEGLSNSGRAALNRKNKMMTSGIRAGREHNASQRADGVTSGSRGGRDHTETGRCDAFQRADGIASGSRGGRDRAEMGTCDAFQRADGVASGSRGGRNHIQTGKCDAFRRADGVASGSRGGRNHTPTGSSSRRSGDVLSSDQNTEGGKGVDKDKTVKQNGKRPREKTDANKGESSNPRERCREEQSIVSYHSDSESDNGKKRCKKEQSIVSYHSDSYSDNGKKTQSVRSHHSPSDSESDNGKKAQNVHYHHCHHSPSESD